MRLWIITIVLVTVLVWRQIASCDQLLKHSCSLLITGFKALISSGLNFHANTISNYKHLTTMVYGSKSPASATNVTSFWHFNLNCKILEVNVRIMQSYFIWVDCNVRSTIRVFKNRKICSKALNHEAASISYNQTPLFLWLNSPTHNILIGIFCFPLFQNKNTLIQSITSQLVHPMTVMIAL